MFAEIITIGDELLIGQVVDTNSAWMGHELNKTGIEIIRRVTVRDRAEEITQAVDAAMKRVRLVFVTGGLGPTKDDITKQTLAKYFGTKLVFSQAVYENIQRVLIHRVPMNSLNKSQAYVPEDATIINNKVGTAPITLFRKGEQMLFSLPGVPQEMKVAMTDEIIPLLKEHYQTDHIIHRTFIVRNYPESVLAEKLEKWENDLPDSIKLAYLPKAGLVRLRLTGRSKNLETLKTSIKEEANKLKSILKADLFESNDSPLEEVIGKMLKTNNLTLSTAESCTGGGIGARITSVPGSSAYFRGGIIAYDNKIKVSLLHVSEDTLAKHGAVSEETVREMVKGAMETLETDCAVATSGIAGPDGGTPQKPVGTIWIAAACKNEIITRKQFSNSGRELNTERAVNNALLLLCELLEKGNIANIQ